MNLRLALLLAIFAAPQAPGTIAAPGPQSSTQTISPQLPAPASPYENGPSYSVNYAPLSGSALGSPCRICPDEIKQGRISDCSFLAALGAVAVVSPGTIQSAIKPDAQSGVYDVSLYRRVGAEPTWFPIGATFPAFHTSWWQNDWLSLRARGLMNVSSDTLFAFAQPPPPVRSGDAPGTVATTVTYWKNLVGSAKRPLWPMLMEKAFAADQPGKQGYTSNFFQNGGLAYEAMEVITGHRGGFYAIGNSEQPTRLVAFSITDSPSVADLGGHSIVGGWLRGDFRAIEPNLMVCAFTPGSRLPNCSPICRESHTCQQPFVNGGVPLDPNNQTVHFEVVDVDGPRSQHRIASFDRNPYDCPDTKPCTINPPESPNGPLAIGFMINRHSRLGGQLPLSTAAEVSAKLTELWNNRRPVVVGTISDIRLYRIGLAPGHAYTLVKYDPSRRELTIRDPITPNPPIPVSIDNFMKLFKQIDYNDADPVPSTNCSCPQ